MFNKQFPEGTVITFDHDGSGSGIHYFSPYIEWDLHVHPLVNMNRSQMVFPSHSQWEELLRQVS